MSVVVERPRHSIDDDSVTIVFQVNGKVREKAEVPRDTPKETLEQQALSLDNVTKFIQGNPVLKIIHVPNKLVNIVVGQSQ